MRHQTTLRYSSVKHVRKGGTHWGKSDLENRPGLLFGQSLPFFYSLFTSADSMQDLESMRLLQCTMYTYVGKTFLLTTRERKLFVKR